MGGNQTVTVERPSALPREHAVVSDQFNGRPVLRVKSLPIFAEHAREHGGEVYNVDEDFLKDIAKWLNSREAEGWLPAIHAEHNGPLAGPRPRLGFGSRAHVGRGVLEGQERAILFVDALVEDEAAARELERRCYRSPEVNLKAKTVESIAAMESEGPWFKFPIASFQLDGGANLPTDYRCTQSVLSTGIDEGLLAFALEEPSGAYRALYRFSPTQYRYSQQEQEAQPMDGLPQDEDRLDDEAQHQDEDEGGEEDLKAVVAALAPMVREMIREEMAAAKSEPPAEASAMRYEAPPAVKVPDGLEEEREQPIVLSSAPTDAQGLARIEAKYSAAIHSMEQRAKAAESRLAATDAHYKAQIGGLLSRLQADEKKTSHEKALTWARSETRQIVLPVDFEDNIKAYAAMNNNTTDASAPLVVYVKSLLSSAPSLPPSALPPEAPQRYRGEPEELDAFLGNPEDAATARYAAQVWQSNPGLRNGKDLKTYVQNYVERHGRNGALHQSA